MGRGGVREEEERSCVSSSLLISVNAEELLMKISCCTYKVKQHSRKLNLSAVFCLVVANRWLDVLFPS